MIETARDREEAAALREVLSERRSAAARYEQLVRGGAERSRIERAREDLRRLTLEADELRGNLLGGLEPELTEHIEAASYCGLDGYANASLTGLYYRELLCEASVQVREGELYALRFPYRVHLGQFSRDRV